MIYKKWWGRRSNSEQLTPFENKPVIISRSSKINSQDYLVYHMEKFLPNFFCAFAKYIGTGKDHTPPTSDYTTNRSITKPTALSGPPERTTLTWPQAAPITGQTADGLPIRTVFGLWPCGAVDRGQTAQKNQQARTNKQCCIMCFMFELPLCAAVCALNEQLNINTHYAKA